MPKTEVSGSSAQLTTVGIGAAVAFYKARKHIARVADPDRPDPARYFWLFKAASLAAMVAAVWWLVSVAPPELMFLLGVFFAVVAAVIYFCVAQYVNFRAAVHRRATGYVISEDSYKHAPRSIKVSMRRIYKAAASIESGRAHQEGMFGDIGVTRLVYSAAQRAVLSSELRASTADLMGAAGLVAAVEQTQLSQTRLQDLTNEVKEVERSLGRTKKTARKLSSDLEAPDRAAKMRRAKEAQKRRQQAAVDRVDEVTARIDGSSAPDARDLEDRVTAVYAGYNETTAITDRAQKLSAPPESDAKRISRPQVAARTTWKAAKSTASGVGKLSKAAASLGSAAVENRRSSRSRSTTVDTQDPSSVHDC